MDQRIRKSVFVVHIDYKIAHFSTKNVGFEKKKLLNACISKIISNFAVRKYELGSNKIIKKDNP